MSAQRVEQPVEIPQVVNLTPAQYRVAMLATSGMTYDQIADQLCLSSQTIKNHLSAVYDAAGIQTAGKPRSHTFIWLIATGKIRLRQVTRKKKTKRYNMHRIDFAALVDLEEDPEFERTRLLKAFERFLDGRLGDD